MVFFSATAAATLSISPRKVRQINDPISQILNQLHKIIFITQVCPLHLLNELRTDNRKTKMKSDSTIKRPEKSDFNRFTVHQIVLRLRLAIFLLYFFFNACKGKASQKYST